MGRKKMSDTETAVDTTETTETPAPQEPVVDAAPAVDPAPAPAVVEPSVKSPHYKCIEPFTAWGHEYGPGDVVDVTGWPEGTTERRVENKFIKFVAG